MNKILIGKILKTHGFKGEMKINVEHNFVPEFSKCEYVFVDNIPYFIENKNILDDNILIKFEEIDNKEKAQELIGKNIFVNSNQISLYIQHLLDDLKDYDVFDGQILIGSVIEKVNLPKQELLHIKMDKKTILIPIHEHFIQSINPEMRQIVLNLPENYIETFLS